MAIAKLGPGYGGEVWIKGGGCGRTFESSIPAQLNVGVVWVHRDVGWRLFGCRPRLAHTSLLFPGAKQTPNRAQSQDKT